MTTGLFNYIDPTSSLDASGNKVKPWAKVDVDQTSFERKQVKREVVDIRAAASLKAFDVDLSGFDVFKSPAKETEFTDDAAVRNGYYGEVEALLKERIPDIKKVVIFDHTIRRREKSSPRQPVQQVHVDQTPGAAEARVRRHTDPSETEELLKGRYQIINVWRPIQNPASDFPLAVIDYRSTKPEDMIKVDLLYPNRNDNDDDDRGKEVLPDESTLKSTEGYTVKGETYSVAPNEGHKFYYAKDMTPEEVMLIKCFDSKSEVHEGGKHGIAGYTPHTAFVDPDTPKDAPGRQSIECTNPDSATMSSSQGPSQGWMQVPQGQFLTLLNLDDGVTPASLPEQFQLTDPDRNILMGRIINNPVYWDRLLNGYIKLGAEPTLDWLTPVHRTQGPGFQTAVVKFIERVYQSPRMPCEGNQLIASDRMTDTAMFYQTHGPCPRPPIDHLTEMLKWLTSGPRLNSYRIGHVCKMIDMLVAKGAIIDLHQNRFIKEYPEVNPDAKKIPDNAVEIAMMPQCPVSFLQTFLSTQTHEEQRFTHMSPVWRASGPILPRGMHFAVTNMEWIVTRIFQDLFDENKYIGPSVCIRHQYFQKLLLLLDPAWTDYTEFNALTRLVEVVEEIEPLFEDKLSDQRRHWDPFAAQVWFRLCRAVSGLADDFYQDDCDQSTRDFGNRRHRFVIDKSWDPRIQWMEGEFEKHISDADSGLAVNRDLKNAWKTMIVERGDDCQWWEIEEQDKWYVSIDEVKQVIDRDPLYGVTI
ncbi:7alpha-cephem-methoxylase p8 chain [Fusarium flagelliforme]|uniref:7alpha-cephem-methoxylase p8 chain n=1 Tax=Fusarium flagelliforme TaxID=2675880 RepID=A0A395MBQ0_9HYPO|nr:7alpha-cephem-methoxylase p8 chain [Fusarium flagelliforme]